MAVENGCCLQEARSLLRAISFQSTFEKNSKIFKSRLKHRGYPARNVEELARLTK